MSTKRSLAALLCLLLMLNFSQLNAQEATPGRLNYPISGIDGVYDEEMGKHLNLSQTINDVTVYLPWAYMDEHQLVIQYAVEGKNHGIVKQVMNASRIQDANGYIFPCCRMTDGQPTTFVPLHARDRQLIFTLPDDYLDQYEVIPDEISLIFELNINNQALKALPPTLPPLEATPEVTPVDDVNNSRVFRFEFSVPIYRALELEPEQTFTVNDIAVTLKTVSVTPASTWIDLCYKLPEGDWVLGNFDARLGENLMFDLNFIVPDYVLMPDCQRFESNTFYSGEPQKLRLSFDYVQEYDWSKFPTTNEGWDAIMPTLEEYDIRVELQNGKDLASIRAGDGDSLKEAMHKLGLWQRIEGPWAFEVSIPAWWLVEPEKGDF